jgi:hypothetical protein
LQAALPHLLAELAQHSDEESIADEAMAALANSRPASSRSSHAGRARRDSDPHGFDETTSVWGLGDTIQSSSSATTRSSSQSLQQSARTVLGETQPVENDIDGGTSDTLTGLLQRLALDNLSLDESLTRSVQRVLQLGTVLTGARLSDDEICSLPKVRFDQAEQQNCSICLEAYQQGEFLTSLPRCQHFFHVDCLARWFRRSTQCPLCRQEQGGI